MSPSPSAHAGQQAAGAQPHALAAPTRSGAKSPDAEAVLKSQEIGFAKLELRSLTQWPWLEIHIAANEGEIRKEEVQALLAFVSDVLYSERANKGFGLTYDFRLLKNPSVGGLIAIARWAAKPERKDLFIQRCIACKTCVPSGWKYRATKAAMTGFFMIQPPTCRTYLTTDFDDPTATSSIFYPPGDAGTAAPASTGAGAEQPPTAKAPEEKSVGGRSPAPAAGASTVTAVLKSQDVGFATLKLQSLAEFPWLDIHITANAGDIRPEQVQQLLAFVSEVLFSERGAKGFGLTYDFRLLQMPNISGLMAIARWAAEPERKDLFIKRCISCRTCVPRGWKYSATRAGMAGFFLILAPTCRTYLTTDFDDPAATTTIFYPPGDDGTTAQIQGRTDACEGGLAGAPSEQLAIPASLRRRRLADAACGSGCGSCFSFLGRPGAHELEQRRLNEERHGKALQRIQELEDSNRKLQAICGKMQGRFDFLHAAVPWVTAVTAVYLLYSATPWMTLR